MSGLTPATGGKEPPRTLFEGDQLRATVLAGSPERLFVTYDFWAADKSGFRPPRQRSSFVDRGYTHLHLSTARNDWFLNRELAPALAAIAEFAEPFRDVASISFSMGGIGLALVSRVVSVDRALLISPHLTVSPRQPPRDARFAAELDDIDHALGIHATLSGAMPAPTGAVIVIDPGQPHDLAHAHAAGRLFKKAKVLELPGGGHPATRAIDNAGHFDRVLDAVTGERLRPGLIRQAHVRAMRRLAAQGSGNSRQAP